MQLVNLYIEQSRSQSTSKEETVDTNIMIKRELFNKGHLIQTIVPDAEIWDVDLNLCTSDDLPKILDLLGSVNTIFGWQKGSKITVFRSQDTNAPRWNHLLKAMHLDVKVGPLSAKRLARLLSDRDIVIKLPKEKVNIVKVNGNEFAREKDLFTDQDDIDALLDGTASISYSFVLEMLEAAGLDASVLKGVEALSFSAATRGGMLKILGYITPDEDMAIADASIILNDANIKSQLWATDDMVSIAFDLFRPYSDPKTNIQTDIMLREILGNQDLDIKLLSDTLGTGKKAIMDGNARRIMEDWSKKSLENKLESSNKVNEDFANLADMAEDFNARGGDYRWSPSLITMMGTGLVNQWYNLKGNWPKYPLPCAWSRPIISESASFLIGDGVDVERGEIRAIRHGDIWVVNDQDYIEFFRFNAGGADLDDHFMLIFRLIDGVNSVIVGRIPMGWREFSVFTFHEGDPFPTYTSVSGKVTSFPAISGVVPKTAFELVRDGEMRITGMGNFDEVLYPEVYGPQIISSVVTEMLSGELGHVGAIINAIMVAAATKPELLSEIVAVMEEIIDSFTKGGGAQVRMVLTEYGESLLEMLDTNGVQIDTKFLGKGGRVGPKKFERATKVNGIYWRRDEANKKIRNMVRTEIDKFGQDYNKQGNELLNKLLDAFNMKYWDVQNTAQPIFVKVRQAQSAFNGHITEMTKANMERARMIAEMERKPVQRINISPEQWTTIYNTHLERLNKIADNDPEMLKLVVMINWMVCLVVRTSKDTITDRSIMNKVMWPVWIQAMVEYGFLMDLDAMVHGAKTEHWNQTATLTCTRCGVTGVAGTKARISFKMHNSCCKACR